MHLKLLGHFKVLSTRTQATLTVYGICTIVIFISKFPYFPWKSIYGFPSIGNEHWQSQLSKTTNPPNPLGQIFFIKRVNIFLQKSKYFSSKGQIFFFKRANISHKKGKYFTQKGQIFPFMLMSLELILELFERVWTFKIGLIDFYGK